MFIYRVGQENLPIWPTWHKIGHNYLSSAGILIQGHPTIATMAHEPFWKPAVSLHPWSEPCGLEC
jgi:hypothetical protein